MQEADTARTRLIEDLLNKVDDLEKTMDRNAFVLVLIDGDGMNVSIVHTGYIRTVMANSHSSSMTSSKTALPVAKRLPSG